MKRLFSKVITLLLIIGIPLSVCACKHEEGAKKLTRRTGIKTETMTETDPPTSTSEPELSPEPTDSVSEPTTKESLSKGSENTTSFDCDVEVLPPREVPAYEYEEIKIEDTEILNKDGLSVHIYGYSVGIGTTRSLLMKVDNQTGHPVTLHLEKILVDGFTEIPLWMNSFENGTTTECELEFFLTLGPDIGLWNPGKFDITFKVEYTDTSETYIAAPGSVLTSAYDENKVIDLSYGYTVYEENGIKISVLGYNPPSRADASLLLYIENNSEHEIFVKTEESLVNGIPVSVNVLQTLFPGEKTATTLTIYKSRLEEVKISTIETISMILRIQFDNDFKNYIILDPFAVSVK